MEYLLNTIISILNYLLHGIYIKSTTNLEDLKEPISNAKNHTHTLHHPIIIVLTLLTTTNII